MAPEEVEAEAFAIYAANQDAGAKLNNILKRAWNRLRLMLNRLRNMRSTAWAIRPARTSSARRAPERSPIA
jgi:hypothetical protein